MIQEREPSTLPFLLASSNPAGADKELGIPPKLKTYVQVAGNPFFQQPAPREVFYGELPFGASFTHNGKIYTKTPFGHKSQRGRSPQTRL